MSSENVDPIRHRGGTNQSERVLRALDPKSAPVDERSLKDMLRFAVEYAKKLNFYDSDNTPNGNWSGFLGGHENLDTLIRIVEDPALGEQSMQPHLALFLTFLNLLRHAQDQMNGITRRHLDFYYRQVLRFSPRNPVPDQAHILVELAPKVMAAELRAGTRFNAGRDRQYRLPDSVVINRAQATQFRTVHVERRITGIEEARTAQTDAGRALISMLRIVYGYPSPGDDLPQLPRTLPQFPIGAQGYNVLDTLESVRDIASFAQEKLSLSMPIFRKLIRLKNKPTPTNAEWEEIYRILRQATGANIHFNPAAPRPIFDQLLEEAVGKITWLPGSGIKNIDDLNARLEDIRLYFHILPEQLTYLMTVVQPNTKAPRASWAQVSAILEDAYLERRTTERLDQMKKFFDTRERTQAQFVSVLNYAAGFDSTTKPGATLNEEQEAALDHLDRFGNLNRNDLDIMASELDPGDSDIDWEHVIDFLEKAMRLTVPIPPAQKVEWINLHAAVDATSVVRTSAIPGTFWETFGMPQMHMDTPPPPFGWAIRSPLLSLSGGERIITLTLDCAKKGFNATAIKQELADSTAYPFIVEISTAKGWLAPDSLTINADDTRPSLTFKLTFKPTAASLGVCVDNPLARETPVLRVMLRQFSADENRYTTHYQPFQDVRLNKASIMVEVDGLAPTHLHNDQGQVAPNKPFEPFGTYPVAGARFYIGHPELITKPVNKMDFHVEWMGVPTDLTAHYRNYDEDFGKKSFQASLSLVDHGMSHKDKKPKNLFNAMTAANIAHTLSMNIDDPTAIRGETDDLLPRWSRYVLWELDAPGFQHDTYPSVVTKKAMEFAAAAVAAPPAPIATSYTVNPPYTPKIKTLTLDYTTPTVELPAACLLHIHPFGYAEIERDANKLFCFLPQYPNKGELYVGLSGVHAPQDLSLLFQLAENTPDPDAPPPPIQWSYLSGNRWLSLMEGILAEQTHGLVQSGIIHFTLPPARPNTLLPPDLYWLRGAIPYNSGGVCATIGVHAQAITVVLHSGEVLPDPLPAGSIAGIADPIPGVAKFVQPYPSFASRIAEPDAMFNTRVSERLRHKERAITLWDYEHLILDHFPQIYRVKCLPSLPENPGLVRVIIIPDIRHSLRRNPFAPMASTSLLREIEAFLKQHTPPFAEVQVSNAYYIPVKLRFGVRFLPGVNEQYYCKQLNDEINRFLSPWAYNPDADIVIGSRIYANTLINFIEQQEYVDYVAALKLWDGESRRWKQISANDEDGVWVEPTRPDGVLVAAPQHEIDMINDDTFVDEVLGGIGYMQIELDFILGPLD